MSCPVVFTTTIPATVAANQHVIVGSVKCKIPARTITDFLSFLQRMSNRIAVGHLQYGSPDKRKLYLTRLEKELHVYKQTGNIEHLYNVANYAFLESVEPEHTNQHFEPTVKSVTRKI